MEFVDKKIDDEYSDIRAEEDDLEDQLMVIRAQIAKLISENELE